MFDKIHEFLSLHTGEEEKTRVLSNVKSNISFRGSNLWILACAIVIACVGLNVNSSAVIIGAMLISPLMGPIVGAGFALGTYDFDLLKKSGKNLLIATGVSLFVAMSYFFLSPFKETQSELLARTSPNIYDVLIAFFGGLVGVIAITRVEKGNPIPGVAIATALMPPLCTAGYGIAVGNLTYFAGAFYLYTINCFFICISTFLIVKHLKYQPVRNIDALLEKKIKNRISILLIIMIVPSIYLAYDLFQERRYVQKVDQFLKHEFSDKGNTIIYQKNNLKSKPRVIELAFLTKKYREDEIVLLNKQLEEYGIKNTTLIIQQETRDIKGEILKEINGQNTMLSSKEIEIKKLRDELDHYKIDDGSILREISILFPDMKDLSIGRHLAYQNTDSVRSFVVLVFCSDKKFASNTENLEKVQRWMEFKLNTQDIKLIRNEKYCTTELTPRAKGHTNR